MEPKGLSSLGAMDSLENPCNVSAGPVWGAANVVILDPSDPSFNVFNAFTYPVKSICLYSMAAIAALLALVEWHLGRISPNTDTARHLQHLHQWLYITYFALSGLGYLVEAIATAVFSQRSGFSLFLISRILSTSSSAPLIGLVNGVGEAIWPSRRWQGIWIFSGVFLVASLTAVMVVASRAGEFALTVVACILGVVHVYAAVIWAIGAFLFAHYKLNCVAALVLAVGLAALAVMDFDCGPAGHAKCYEKCITFPGGHYLLAFVPIFFAYTLLGMSHTDPPKELTWAEAFRISQRFDRSFDRSLDSSFDRHFRSAEPSASDSGARAAAESYT